MANKVAPDGRVYVCCACGKTSRDRYGEEAISHGWDESCMLNCVLAWEKHLTYSRDGCLLSNVEGDRRLQRVVEITEGGIVEEEER